MSATDWLDARTAGIGAGTGLAAYLAGYLVTYLTHRNSMDERLEVSNALLEFFQNEPVASWQSVGWLFYNAHFVETVVPWFGGPELVNFVAEGDGGASTLLYVVPPLLLLLAGVGVATVARAETPTDGALAGVLPVLGYLPAAALGIVAVTYGVGDGAVHPDWVTGVLLAGLAYPVVIGGVGGAIGAFVADRG